MKRNPRDYLNSCYFTTGPDEGTLPAVISTFGEEIILFGSDYPHFESRFPHSVRRLQERKDLSDAAKESILRRNGEKYFGLNTPLLAAESR